MDGEGGCAFIIKEEDTNQYASLVLLEGSRRMWFIYLTRKANVARYDLIFWGFLILGVKEDGYEY